MRFVADENVDRRIVELLRRERHEVRYVAEEGGGLDDQDVLRLAEELGALLITFDKDFGELVFNQRLGSRGVILLRLAWSAGGSQGRARSSSARAARSRPGGSLYRRRGG